MLLTDSQYNTAKELTVDRMASLMRANWTGGLETVDGRAVIEAVARFYRDTDRGHGVTRLDVLDALACRAYGRVIDNIRAGFMQPAAPVNEPGNVWHVLVQEPELSHLDN